MSVDDAQMEIDRLVEEARREQNAAWYGPAFYGFAPVSCDRPNQQCLSFRLVYVDDTPADMRTSLEEALVHHGCHLDKEAAPAVDGYLTCSAVSQQGNVAIKKVRAMLRRWQERGRLTYVDEHDRIEPLVRGSGATGIVRRSRAQGGDTSHVRSAHLTNISQTGRKCRETRR